MANSTRYFKTPFATSGSRTDLPDESISGYVALDTGYGADYELAQGDTNRKRIERTTFNQIFYAITENLKQWQENNYPTWIEDTGAGTPFSYDSGVVVTHDSEIWISIEGANADEPSATSIKWTKYDRASALSVSGTGGAITQTLAETQSILNKSELFQSESVGSSTQSASLPNGLIMKFGSKSNYGTVTFDEAFPGGCIQAFATRSAFVSNGSNLNVTTISSSSITITSDDNFAGGLRWFAIGY